MKTSYTIKLFVLQIYFLETLDKTLTKNPVVKFKRCAFRKNKQDLIKVFKSEWECVRMCKILVKNPRTLTLGIHLLNIL